MIWILLGLVVGASVAYCISPLVVVWQDTFLLQTVLDFLINSFNLPIRITAAYHKIIGKAAHLTRIQQQDIRSLLIIGRFYYPTGYLQRLQKPNLHA